MEMSQTRAYKHVETGHCASVGLEYKINFDNKL